MKAKEADRKDGADYNTIINSAFRSILRNTEDMMFVKDIHHVYVAASLPFANMLGKDTVEDIIGHTDYELLEDQILADQYVADDIRLLTSGEDLLNYVEPMCEKDGTPGYAATSRYLLYDNEGSVVGLLGISRDITRNYLANRRFQQELKYLFELPVDTYAAIFIDVDGWRLVTERRQNVRGYSTENLSRVETFLKMSREGVADQDSAAADFYRNFNQKRLWDIYNSGRRDMVLEYQRKRKDGSVCWVRDEIAFLIDPQNDHLCVMVMVRDIDGKKKAEKDILQAAETDGLTGVYNRVATMKRIEALLAENHSQEHALFMMDVDHFKQINDTLGHQAGDEFLIAMAEKIRSCFREADIIGRIGGDEFFVLMQSAGHLNNVRKKARRLQSILRKLCEPYEMAELSVSIGVSLYPRDAETLAELYTSVDAALYQAKRAGRDRVVFASDMVL